jgi:hypothetical protein
MSKTFTNYMLGDNTGYGVSTNSDYYVSEVNKQTLCGASNWRLPTYDEVKSLVFCSDGKYNSMAKLYGQEVGGLICTNGDRTSVIKPTLNILFFPYKNAISIGPWGLWCSTRVLDNNNFAWIIDFGNGSSGKVDKFDTFNIQLVR